MILLIYWENIDTTNPYFFYFSQNEYCMTGLGNVYVTAAVQQAAEQKLPLDGEQRRQSAAQISPD